MTCASQSMSHVNQCYSIGIKDVAYTWRHHLFYRVSSRCCEKYTTPYEFSPNQVLDHDVLLLDRYCFPTRLSSSLGPTPSCFGYILPAAYCTWRNCRATTATLHSHGSVFTKGPSTAEILHTIHQSSRRQMTAPLQWTIQCILQIK